jgi:nitric oxide synthase-interacting protein
MGRGSRHSKNAGTMGVEAMTYAERRTLGYGTAHERLSKDCVGDFDDCQLTLQPAVEPVCTSFGVLYSKEAILEYLLQQTKINNRKSTIWKKFRDKENYEINERHQLESQLEIAKFERKNFIEKTKDSVNPTYKDELKKKSYKTMHTDVLCCSNLNIQANQDRMKEVKVFWGPTMIPETPKNQIISHVKPQTYTTCPISGVKLGIKDLIPVKFTRLPTNSSITSVVNKAKYIDPITKDVLTNRSNLVCIRPTGDVLLLDVYKKFVEPYGMYNGVKISGLIQLQKGGTGYVAHDGKSIKASKYTYLGLGSGLTDLRGQHSGAGVKTGLVLL